MSTFVDTEMSIARCQGVHRHNPTVINALLGPAASLRTFRQLSRHASRRSPDCPFSHGRASLTQNRGRSQCTTLVTAATGGTPPPPPPPPPPETSLGT